MDMFQSFLESIPKNRSEFVDDLELPEVTLTPYLLTPEDSSTIDSLISVPESVEEYEVRTGQSVDSSLSLSRAMTDSEIDYEMSRRMRCRRYSDPWDYLRAAIDAFPPDYIASLNSFSIESFTNEEPELVPYENRLYNEELRLKMERYFDDICVFSPEDPGLAALEEALINVDLQSIDDGLDLERL